MPENSQVLAALRHKFPQALRSVHSMHGDDTALIDAAAIVEVATFLKEDPRMEFNFLMDLTAVDYPEEEPRFEMVYHFYSTRHNRRVRIKARVPEQNPLIDSLTPLWPGADWYEREVWDMFGVRFANHPNLKRILLYEEFEGHPLRKDYDKKRRQPLVGPKN